MKKKVLLILSVCFGFLISFSSAHPGNTDAYWCHTCRTNCSKRWLKTWEYHCHNSKWISQPLPQVTSSSKTNTTSYVTPKKTPTKIEFTEAKDIIATNMSSNSTQYNTVDKLVTLLDDPEVSKAVKEYQIALANMNKILKAKLTEIEKQL